MKNDDESNPRRAVWRWWVVGLGAVAVVVGSICGVWGRPTLERLLTSLAMPCGILWFGVGVGCLLAWRQRRPVLFAWLAAVFFAYTLAGNRQFGDWLLGGLERDFYEADPFGAEPFDMLVVLGGGTERLATGKVQVGGQGDRIVLSARLYHQGKVARLVATGTSLTAEGYKDRGAAKAMATIWRDLGIPASAVTTIGGRNTSEEMRELKTLLDKHPGIRVGLLTSAWHLPRALRLARGQGIDAVPVPAAFQTRQYYPPILGMIPNAESFQKTQLATKEFLASMVGR